MITYEKSLALIGLRRELIRVMRTRELRFFGLTSRRNCLEKEVLLGGKKGRRAGSRPQYSTNLEMAQNR